MKKITIIGANSYIARNLIYTFKHYPDCILNLYDYGDFQVDGLKNYESIRVLEQESLKKINFNCDVVFVFVGKTGTAVGFEEYESFIDINEKALLNIINEYRIQKSNAKLVFPSTRLVYKGKKGLLDENAEKEFKTVYAINKFACEQYLAQYNAIFGIKYCIFRICLPYGSLIQNATSYGTAEFMLSKAKRGENITLYGDGKLRRTLTYIGDLCNALIEGAFSNCCLNDIYNIGGEDYSLLEMAELIAKKYKVGITHMEWPKISQKIESGDTVFDSNKFDRLNLCKQTMKFADWCNLPGVNI